MYFDDTRLSRSVNFLHVELCISRTYSALPKLLRPRLFSRWERNRKIWHVWWKSEFCGQSKSSASIIIWLFERQLEAPHMMGGAHKLCTWLLSGFCETELNWKQNTRDSNWRRGTLKAFLIWQLLLMWLRTIGSLELGQRLDWLSFLYWGGGGGGHRHTSRNFNEEKREHNFNFKVIMISQIKDMPTH